MSQQEILILNQKCAHTLSFYNPTTGEELNRIRLPDYPHEFVVDSKQRYAYVGHYGILGAHCVGDEGGCSVFVIDLDTCNHIYTLSTWPYYRIHGLGMDDQDRLFAMSEGHNTLLRFSDPLSIAAPDMAVSSGGYKTHLFALSRDGETAYGINLLSNTVTKIKPNDATFAPVAMIPGRMPEGNCLSADERTLFVSNRTDNSIVAIDVETMTVRDKADTGIDPTRIYCDPQNRLVVTNYGENSLSLFDQKLNSLGKMALEHIPIAMSFHPNGKKAYISFKGDQMGVLNLDTGKIENYFPTRDEPHVSFLLLR